MSREKIALLVHASHEAGLKVGGIGAVLDGLLRSPIYNAAVSRTVLAGPLNVQNKGEMERLTAPANHLTILYSCIHGVNSASESVAAALRAIEERMHVRLVYGRRAFGAVEHEVILVDAQAILADVANGFKAALWDRWRLPSDRYESDREYDFHISAAGPLFAALEAVTHDLPQSSRRVMIAHEWLGLPLVFSALAHAPHRYKTVFYAHEVATARLLVEGDKGHDTRFYNALRLGLAQKSFLTATFGDQSWFYKHALIERATACDGIFAVGDLVVDELRFLGGDFPAASIDLVYNGVPAEEISLERKQHSHRLLQQYAANLLGFEPDYVFTHVSRMVVSKALWRDTRVLERLDGMLASAGKTAVLFVVSSADPAGRLPADVYRWEKEYGWPVAHRNGNGDLRGDELEYYLYRVQPLNAHHHAVRAVLFNQFGWSRERCGLRMPAEMTFADLRAGSDLEFGQSIYEPFGIAQVEPLGAGALCVVSSVCGCVGFGGRAAAGRPFPNLIVSDYVTLPASRPVRTLAEALLISGAEREQIEAANSYGVAQQVFERLPRNQEDVRRLLEGGQSVARGMSWDVVVRDYLLPALHRLL